MKTILKIIFLFMVVNSSLFSQKEYHNWYFGQQSGITFNTPNEEPIFLEGNLSRATENTSIISDYGGVLLYYSAINCIYNNEGVVFCDADTIAGAWSTTQGSIILPIDSNTFIRIGCGYTVDYISVPHPLSFIVFQNKDKNFQIIKHDTILNNYNSENILVIKDFNSNSFYLIVNDRYESEYKLYKYDIESQSFNLLHTLASKFIFDMNSKSSTAGYLKSTLSGKSIASFHNTVGVELLELDNQKEILKFKNTIVEKPTAENEIYYSGEFSPDGKYLYFSTSDGKSNYLSKVNILNDEIELKIENLFEIKRSMSNTFLLGPNLKLYFTSESNNYLSSFESPNNPIDVRYLKNSVNLKGTATASSLPNIPTTYYNLLSLPDTTFVCLNEEVLIKSILYAPFKDTIYEWTGPNGFISNLPNPIINNATDSAEGYYYLTVFNGDSSISYKRKTYLKVIPDSKPTLRAYPKAFLCNEGEITISLNEQHVSYLWTTGDTTDFISVTKSGTYGVTVTNEVGCEAYVEMNVGFGNDYKLAIEGDTLKCTAESVTLTSTDEYPEYKWSNGEKTRSITVTNPARYSLTVKTEEGCSISRTIEVKDHPKVNADLKPTPTTICSGDSALLQSKYDFPYYSYEWNTGAKTREINVSQSGTYKLIITDTRLGCSDSTEIVINVEENLKPTITPNDLCTGRSAILTALPNDPSYTYKWSNGEETPVIEISVAGTYSVTVSKAGCVGTAEYTVKENPVPVFTILGENVICGNETVTLSSSEEFDEYLWSTNEITKEIEVDKAGLYELTITNQYGCSTTETYKVEKYDLNFVISKSSLVYGKVYISELKNENIVITNNSGFGITLQGGQVIADGESYPYNYNFAPTQLGAYNKSLEISIIEPCDSVITIPVAANVFARATISTDDIYTQIGQTVSIPVYLECESDLTSQEYSITTDIDQSVFYTKDNYTTNQNQPIIKTKTKIYDLTGIILLSDSLETDITFPEIRFTNPFIELVQTEGRIYIDSVCAFIYRKVEFLDPTTLSINPNPASERLNIDITTGTQGTLTLELVSTDGRVIYSSSWQQATKSKQMQINTLNIPSGLYQLRLITPYDATTKSVMVVE